uniref:Toll-like receptor 18 n=1 Tax=Labrus bergylta TaxID=56723 RepID=A0A3Q3EPK3_9LABR
MIWKWIYLTSLLPGALTSPTPPSRPNTTAVEGPCHIYNSGHSADCRGRQLESVPWTQFPPTLEEIDLSSNKLQAILANDFLRLPRLRVLLLKFNNISHIDSEAFKNNKLLEHLDIFNNSLREIPATALTPLLNLKQLMMSNNLYDHATLDESFSKLVHLKVLSMGGPLVMGLKKADFQPLKNMRLHGFAIKCSSNLSYYEPGSLEVVQTMQMGFDMALDQRSVALHHMLRDLANKTFSVIQFRNLFEFTYYMGTDDIFQGLRYVTAQQLVFHRGKFNENLLRMALMNLEVAPIRNLRLQYIDFARSPTFIDNGGDSSITDLALDELDLWYISNPDVLRFDWRFTWFNKIKHLSIQYVNFNSVPCDAWAEMGLLRLWTSPTIDYRTTTSLTNLLEKVETASVSPCVVCHHGAILGPVHCDLDQLDITYFEKANSLKELLLSGNKIKFIPFQWGSPSLQSLALDGNSFGVISKASFRDMPRLSHLRAGNNPFHCTCELHINLTDWPENYKCYHPEAFLNTVVSKYLPGRVACDIRLVIIICVATTMLVIFILMLMCYMFDLPWYTKATFQIIRAKYRAHKEKAAGEAGSFTYHAFISYSHSDADWVRDQLLPCLESDKNPYRLCIHERDFMPGRWIIDNIIDNIESSRKVIFVLSRHFVNSEWCNYELYFAQQRAMGKTFNDVILVVKEPLDPSSLPSKYCKLKKMLSTKTYLEWPQQVSQQPFFWAQLKSVLGKPTVTREGRHSVRSIASSVIGSEVVDRKAEEAQLNAEPKNKINKMNNYELSNQTHIPAVAF